MYLCYAMYIGTTTKLKMSETLMIFFQQIIAEDRYYGICPLRARNKVLIAI